MFHAICQTCNDRIRTERKDVANEFVVEHLRYGHRASREPLDRDGIDPGEPGTAGETTAGTPRDDRATR